MTSFPPLPAEPIGPKTRHAPEPRDPPLRGPAAGGRPPAPRGALPASDVGGGTRPPPGRAGRKPPRPRPVGDAGVRPC